MKLTKPHALCCRNKRMHTRVFNNGRHRKRVVMSALLISKVYTSHHCSFVNSQGYGQDYNTQQSTILKDKFTSMLRQVFGNVSAEKQFLVTCFVARGVLHVAPFSAYPNFPNTKQSISIPSILSFSHKNRCLSLWWNQERISFTTVPSSSHTLTPIHPHPHILILTPSHKHRAGPQCCGSESSGSNRGAGPKPESKVRHHISTPISTLLRYRFKLLCGFSCWLQY